MSKYQNLGNHTNTISSLVPTLTKDPDIIVMNQQKSMTYTQDFDKEERQLDRNDWIKLVKYSHKYISNYKSKILPEQNESGFYRINIETPNFLPKALGIEKIRLHYWSTDDSSFFQEESIHSHPKYFESYIVNGGYKHTIYEKIDKSKSLANDKQQPFKKYNLFKMQKTSNISKNYQNLGKVYLKENKVEKVKEGTIVSMPKSIIHKVMFSIPGSLSINVVYKNNYIQKTEYDILISNSGNKDNVRLTRATLTNTKRKKVLNEIENVLFNSVFQLS